LILIGSLDASGPTVSEALRRLAHVFRHLDCGCGLIEECRHRDDVGYVFRDFRHFLLLLLAARRMASHCNQKTDVNGIM
jgi:hypothetical protein